MAGRIPLAFLAGFASFVAPCVLPLVPGYLATIRDRGSRVLLGAAFATCAAPCVSPILASTLVLAADRSTVADGALLLFAYSLGLAIPFVAAGVLFGPAMGAFRW